MDRFMQIHFLTSYAATLLNRDDAGLAKRLPFGGTIRTRVSSQCLKRHWRTAEDAHALANLEGVEMSLRSRRTFEEKVAKPLLEEGLERKKVEAAVAAFQDQLLGSSARAKKEKTDKAEKGDAGTSLLTSQVVILGWPEIRFIQEKVRAIASQAASPEAATKGVEGFFKAESKNMKALMATGRLPAGLDAALFGRMVTSDILTRLDAAIHVAHAFTVHGHELETDYFSALDDLMQESGDLGSGHINDSELTSGLFYGYVVVDVPLLVSNLSGNAELAARVVENLIHLIATVSPGAKKGATAPYACAEMVLVESGNRQPRTLANAFRKAVALNHRGDVRDAAIAQLGAYLEKFDAMYGGDEVRQVAAMADTSALKATVAPALNDLCQWSASRIRGVA
ncbi:MAG: type I-E CRISPR-associated protein Cas7/Cse4/CasC [Magnetococcales bacterium]|nr:type I-E CRISPR-associated protein Cas7/Cse4/CasC [Magnetococcales bacterium]